MADTFEFTLDNPLTEEQWDQIADVDFDRTDRIWFHTKHGKEVEFAKVRHGRWMPREEGKVYPFWERYTCSVCGEHADNTQYCPNCGARMDEE